MNTIAKTIYQQIGGQAFVMMGAKNIGYTENGLSFKIGRNSGGFSHISIKLNSMDLYDITFHKIRKHKDTPQIETGIYNDMLHKLIEDNTGMYLSL